MYLGNKSNKISINKPLDMRLNSLAVEHAKKMQKDIIKAKHHFAKQGHLKIDMQIVALHAATICHKLKIKKS